MMSITKSTQRASQASKKRFGTALRTARRERGLTQSGLGLMSASSVSRIEQGERPIDRSTVLVWSNALNAPHLIDIFDECIANIISGKGASLHARNYRVTSDDFTLRLTKDVPEYYQVCNFVAFAPLDSVSHHGTFFRVDGIRPIVEVESNEGCRIVDFEWVADELATWSVVFPRTIVAGDTWRYTLTTRISRIRPRLTVTTRVGVDHVTLRIAFPAEANPRIVRLDGVLPSLAQDHEAAMRTGIEVCLDPFGQVEVEYHDPQAGLTYGFTWQE